MPSHNHKDNVSLYTTGVTYAAEIAYPYEGLKFIHGFNGVLNTVWYLEDINSFMVLIGFRLPFGIWRT
jgi:hypothetical protein